MVRRLPIVEPVRPGAILAAATPVLSSVVMEEGPSEAAASALAWATDLTERVKQRIVPTRPIDCKAGCAYCCHLKVTATAPEVIRIANHLRNTRSEAELAALVETLRRFRETVGARSEDRGRRTTACPLLLNERCSVYEVRPLHCTGANSYDAEACRNAFEAREREEELGIPVYAPQQQVAEVLHASLSNACMSQGKDGRVLELVAALGVALEQADCEQRWRAGEPVFESAVDAEFLEMLKAGG